MTIRRQWLLQAALLAAPLCTVAQQEKKIPALQEVVKAGSRAFKGMFTIYVQDDKYLAEIPDRLMGRDILTSITIVRGSAQRKRNAAMRLGWAGDAVNDRVIQLRKTAGNRIEITTPVYAQATDSANIYYRTLQTSLLPAYLSFAVKARTDSSSLIDLTEALESDNDLVSLKGAKEELKLGAYEPEKSGILGVKCFENNVVFRTVKSYAEAPPVKQEGEEAAPPSNATMWEVGASWYLLPEKPMQPRLADRRVGYFVTVQKSYDKNPEQAETIALADRWRIEPKPEDLAAWQKGQLVAPAKPIVFYVDRNMPGYLVPYVMKGVNAWQQSFEKIGFKNAIYARLAPSAAEDSTYSMEDARYSFISYKPSEMANAYGPHVVDPRSGEILTSHIGVFHNVLDLLQRWYFSMCAATDTAARNIPMQQELMGRMMVNVITHEVGHTLGLRHDFAGSASYHTDSIRIPAYVRAHGFGPSIMDYMRFNYAAQPEDGMTAQDLMPGIGVYDDFAIEWGYRYRPDFTNAYAESKVLADWVSEKRKDARFFYRDESDLTDPRVQSEDIGHSSMQASRLGILNLKRTMEHLEQWVGADDEQYTQLRSMYRAVQGRYYTYLKHVLKNIGGSFNDMAIRSEQKDNYIAVSKAQQKEAMAFLQDFLLKEQRWLYPAAICAKTRFDFNREVVPAYSDLIGRTVSRYFFVNKNVELSGDTCYTPQEYLKNLYQCVFARFTASQSLSQYERLVQRTFVNSMLMHAENKAVSLELNVTMTGFMNAIEAKGRQAATMNKDALTAAHYRALADLIGAWKTNTKEVYLK